MIAVQSLKRELLNDVEQPMPQFSWDSPFNYDVTNIKFKLKKKNLDFFFLFLENDGILVYIRHLKKNSSWEKWMESPKVT